MVYYFGIVFEIDRSEGIKKVGKMKNMKRILIVDPDPNIVKKFCSLFEDEGFDVAVSRRIADAVVRIEDVKFDCIIVDVDQQDMKGYDAVSIFKAINPKSEVIMTAKKNTKELEAKVRDQDIFYYYIKSFNKGELMLAVNNVFKKLGMENQMNKKNQSTKILLIDDDPDFLKSMKLILESASYKFVDADNPREGMEKIKSEKPDLILLDIMMDSLFDGFSMCHRLKTSKEYREYHKTPVIFVSAVKEKSGSGSRFAFRQNDCGLVGPDDYIDKPVEPTDLLRRIEKLLLK